jgi:hypothetical protein
MLEPALVAPLTRGSSVRALPRRQASWVAAQALTGGALALTGLWVAEPELALALSLGAGVAAVNPRKFWAIPLVGAAMMVAGLVTQALDMPSVLGVGAVAGVLLTWLLPEQTDWLDALNGALATAAGATIGLWTAQNLLPDVVGSWWGATLCSVLVGLVASQGLVPLAVRFDNPQVPSARAVRRALKNPYRPPVFQALELYAVAARQAPDTETRRGMAEVASWVFRLQRTLQTLDTELEAIDPLRIEERIRACEQDEAADTFTRERRQATAVHLRRLLEHRSAIATERQRTEALVEYALAFLEEARAGLAVARELPGEATPDRLPEVLHRLRSHAAAGDARRKTAREMGKMEA